MSSPAAASGFLLLLLLLLLLLPLPGIQGQGVWRVTYTPLKVCAVKGSTVEIRCSYSYPSKIKSLTTTVVETVWFIKEINGVYVDLGTDPEYSGRVQRGCERNICSLTISDLRESDSAEYKFRFTTNQPGGTYHGSPGVSLTVTDLQVKVSRYIRDPGNWVQLTCQSRCRPPGGALYVWYKNGQEVEERTSQWCSLEVQPADVVSCALRGHLAVPSPAVYAPRRPSVSLSPSPEVEEGGSVTLSCSSDANPAASYTWYKEDEEEPAASGPIFLINDFRAEHSGRYRCDAQNNMGSSNSTCQLTVAAGALPPAAIGATAAALLAVSLFSVFLWMRRKRASRKSSEPEDRPDVRTQSPPGQPAGRDDLHYASVHFAKSQAEPVYSTVEYAAVTFRSAAAAPRTRRPDPEEEPAALYSSVNRNL